MRSFADPTYTRSIFFYRYLLHCVCVMHFFSLFCQIMDINYFFGSDFTDFSAEPLRSSVPLQWTLDLMCEKLQGVSNFLLL